MLDAVFARARSWQRSDECSQHDKRRASAGRVAEPTLGFTARHAERRCGRLSSCAHERAAPEHPARRRSAGAVAVARLRRRRSRPAGARRGHGRAWATARATGITGWSLPAIDGLRPARPIRTPRPREHPNGAVALDHVVVLTPDFDRTAAAFDAAGLAFRRVRDGGGFRQGFRRAGPAIVEVVEAVGARPGPARFWGLVPIVADLDALCEQLGPELMGEPKPAVQPGRRIATVRRAAGLSARWRS